MGGDGPGVPEILGGFHFYVGCFGRERGEGGLCCC